MKKLRTLAVGAVLLGLVVWAGPAFAESGGSSHFDLTVDEGIFSLYCALNAGGYDGIGSFLGMHPVRVRVREATADRDDLNEAISEFGRAAMAMNRGGHAAMKYVLLSSGPPEFAATSRASLSRESRWVLANGKEMGKALAVFYHQAGIHSLWEDARPENERVVARVAEVADSIASAILPTVGVMGPADIRARVTVIPNLADAYWTSYDFRIEDKPYLVVGPGIDLDPSVLVRVLLKSIFERAARGSYLKIREKREIFELVKDHADIRATCGSFHELVTECLVWAVWLKRSGQDPRWIEGELDRLYARGFILVKAFYQTLPNEVPGGPERLVQRVITVTQVERLKNKWEQSAVERKRWLDIFQADTDRRRGRYADAQALYEGVLKADPDNPRALFGLGSLRYSEERYEEARTALEQCIQVRPDEKSIEAWSWIRIGWIEDLKGNRPDALEAYRRAVELGSTHRNALAIAKRGLEQPLRQSTRQ